VDFGVQVPFDTARAGLYPISAVMIGVLDNCTVPYINPRTDAIHEQLDTNEIPGVQMGTDL